MTTDLRAALDNAAKLLRTSPTMAEAQAREILGAFHGEINASQLLGAALRAQGRYDEALKEMHHDQFYSGLEYEEIENIVHAVSRFKLKGEQTQLPEQLEVKILSPEMVARLFALSGNQTEALTCLRRGFHDANMWTPFSFSDPAFDDIRETAAGKLLFARNNVPGN